MSSLQTYYDFKLDLQKVDQHTGGKRLIHCTKRCKDNQLQSLKYGWLPTLLKLDDDKARLKSLQLSHRL